MPILRDQHQYSPISLQGILLPQRTVLYVEDNAANMALVSQLIERRVDLKFLMSTDGQSGLQAAKEHHPDVIVLDINLPDMNGFDVLKALRNEPATAYIPVIALSSDAYPRQIEKGIKAGFICYLTKPFKINEFMKALDATLCFALENSQKNK